MMRHVAVATLLVIALATAAPARAQLSAPFPSIAMSGADVAYDSSHDAYLVVGTGTHATQAIFVSAASHAPSAAFPILPTDPMGPIAAAYSADLSDGAGGLGAFLVLWDSGTGINAEIVAYPGRVV